MTITGVDFKWYDGFFLSMLATSIIIVAMNWKRYHLCTHPLHIWIVVDYTTVFVFRLLMFVDNGLSAGMGLDFGRQQRHSRFWGRTVVISILSLLLYPFLWVWTIIGTLWFTGARNCLPEEGQKWGFLIWLLFSYCGLLCIACISLRKVSRDSCKVQTPFLEKNKSREPLSSPLFPSAGIRILVICWFDLVYVLLLLKGFLFHNQQTHALLIILFFNFPFQWLTRREVHLQRAQQGIPISEYGVFVDMIRVPDWAYEAAGQELRGMGQDAAAYHPGLYLTPAQREAVEALIQELPKFRLKAVPTDCNECPICLEEFHEGNEVRGLPCAHNFHVECIDEWLRLNVKCPRCRCSVFPNLDLSALSNISAESERSSASVVTTSRYVRSQPSSQSYLLRLQGLLRSVRAENAGPGNDVVIALETAENGGLPVATRGSASVEPGQGLAR